MTNSEQHVDRVLAKLACRELTEAEREALRSNVERRLEVGRARPHWRLRLLPSLLILSASVGLAAAGSIEAATRWLWSVTILDADGTLSESEVQELRTDASGTTTLLVDTHGLNSGGSDANGADTRTEISVTPSTTEDGRTRLDVRLPEDGGMRSGVLVLRAQPDPEGR